MPRVRAAVLGGAVAVFMVLAVGTPPAFASPPANDTIGAAVVVGAMPFTFQEPTTEATADGPTFCGNNSSVFFRFVPTQTARVQVDTFGSDYDTVLSVFVGSGPTVTPVACSDDRYVSQSGVRFTARAGTTYYIMAATCCGHGYSGYGGSLDLRVDRVATAPVQGGLEIRSGTVDPVTGLVTLSGVASCNERALVAVGGVLRQVRNQIYSARAGFYYVVACTPGEQTPWSMVLESETDIVFGAGSAGIDSQVYVTDAFRSQVLLPVTHGKMTLT